MEFKVNIGDPKTGKSVKKIFKDDECKPFLNKKIGAEINGDLIGFEGYEFMITGGSDDCGFPMRKDVEGTLRKKILLTSGVGIRCNVKGKRIRKNVAGNIIYSKTAQINLKVTKQGKKPLVEEKKEETPVEEKKEEKPKEHPKKEKKEPEEKTEEKKVEKKEQKPEEKHKEEKKEHKKEEKEEKK